MNLTLPKILRAITTIAGLVVMVGWFLDIEILKSIVSGFVTMKFTTAFSFFLSGIILFSFTTYMEGKTDLSQIVISMTALVMFILISTIFVSSIMNVKTGLESLFVEESEEAVFTVSSGIPSIGTILNFMMVIAISYIAYIRSMRTRLILIESIGIIIVSLIALFGYLINKPFLFYSIEGISTAMAIHTAILFLLLGIGFASFSLKVRKL